LRFVGVLGVGEGHLLHGRTRGGGITGVFHQILEVFFRVSLRFKHSRKLNGVSAEMSLNVLAYNLKRVMKIMGTEGLLKAMTA